ncbi:thioredoxin [Clostridioides difficile]|uniref:thioredoxin n=1 Tax=Clostridioides difficile TaxID=1496 RepID=UPI000D1E9CE0|nr:thioredoxin [Clostridioides difficile]UUC41655.1 thioredoxin [Clostridioides difficile]UWD41545.1 thioredoxin [Clostridioides difficile]UWD45186.1 thioredoxin [Clostridioides difficile]VFC56463.1 thioredoxin [Clostridioides difficile]VFF93548.1 thioredoxin [Clostridioides difficile]
MIKIINHNEFINEVENKDGLVVVDFFATWCGPCKMLSPIYEALGDEMAEKAKFLKVDIDQSIELAQKFEVSTVPTMMIFKDGKPVDRLIGFMPKDNLKKKVESYM